MKIENPNGDDSGNQHNRRWELDFKVDVSDFDGGIWVDVFVD